MFLDDDPCRAEAFLNDHPQAVWVTTVPECLARLAEPWDEVHLDHDLGGKLYVDSSDTDCGMEVIRWLCREPRPHLKQVLFFVHTHNETAGLLMVLLMRCGGYKAEFRPFGLDLAKLLAHNETGARSVVNSLVLAPLRNRAAGALRLLGDAVAALARRRAGGWGLPGGQGAEVVSSQLREGQTPNSPPSPAAGEAQPSARATEP